MELREGFHDDANERQVKQGNSGFDLRVGIAWVRVMAGEQIMDHAYDLLMETKHPTERRIKEYKLHILCQTFEWPS